MKTVNIKGKEYIEVNERLKYFRKNYTNYSLESEVVELKDGVITIKAIIKDENQRIIATGLAQEKESSSFINKTSFVENCETSAWGRALGNLGIGIDTSVASAEEIQNAINNQQKPISKKATITEDDKTLIGSVISCNSVEELKELYTSIKDLMSSQDALNLLNKETNKRKGELTNG